MRTFAQDLSSYLPAGFASYARVFHPVGVERRSWADVAAEHGRTPHADMQLHALLGTDDPWPDGFEAGSLPVHEATVLVEYLRVASTTPQRCWYCLWEGWGALDHGTVSERVCLPCRTYLLAEGPIELALRSFGGPNMYHQSANLWWPDDRAWVVATEIDFAWTYVGGSNDLVNGLVSDRRIEAHTVTPAHCGSFDADIINTESAKGK